MKVKRSVALEAMRLFDAQGIAKAHAMKRKAGFQTHAGVPAPRIVLGLSKWAEKTWWKAKGYSHYPRIKPFNNELDLPSSDPYSVLEDTLERIHPTEAFRTVQRRLDKIAACPELYSLD